MAVKLIAKAKAKTKVKEVVELAPYAPIVEKMAALKATLEMMKVTQAEYDDNRKFLLGKIPEDTPAGKPYEFEGISHIAYFNKEPMSRTLKPGAMKKLHEMMGDDIFYSLCSIPLTKIDQYVAPIEQEELFDVNYAGSRTCVIKSK